MTKIDVPGPRPLPVLGYRGNFLAFVSDAPGWLRRLHEQYGEIASLARGHDGHVFVFSPRYNRQVLSDPTLFHNLDAASAPVRMKPGSSLQRLYAGLTNMNGAEHRRQRKLMGSALTRQHVEAYADDIAALAGREMARWQAGSRIDLLARMRVLTMAVAVKTLLGLAPERGGERVGALLQDWMDAVFSMPALALPVDFPGLPYHRLQVLSRVLERQVRDLIEQRRASGGGTDVLSRMTGGVEDGAAFTDDELIGQTAFLFMAGHATTASALAWTVLLLCCHPEVMTGVADELAGVLHGEPPTAGRLAELPLLDRVVKESLRLLPPVMWWGKMSTAPFELGGYQLPAGATVAFSPYITHRLPDIYPAPDRFLPDRWLTCDPGPYEYLPFSAGPRTCLGAGFATMEMKLVLATMLQQWWPRLPAGVRVDQGGLMVSQPKRGLPVILQPPGEPVPRPEVRGAIHRIVDLAGAAPLARR